MATGDRIKLIGNTESLSLGEAKGVRTYYHNIENPTNTLTTVLNVNGEGLLHHCYLRMNTRVSDCEVEIRIDGDIIYYVTTRSALAAQFHGFGIVDLNFLDMPSSTGEFTPYPFVDRVYFPNMPSHTVELPFSDTTKLRQESAVAFIPKPIKFNSNLRVRVKAPDLSADSDGLAVVNVLYRLED